MHQPPAVSFTVTRSKRHFVFLLAIWLLAAFSLLAVLLTVALTLLTKVVVIVCLACSGLWAMSEWKCVGQSSLFWDGTRWHWSGFESAPVEQLAIVFDFQKVVLVRIYASGYGVRWLWLDAPVRNRQWAAMRRALVGATADL
jgi:hypothetical protein